MLCSKSLAIKPTLRQKQLLYFCPLPADAPQPIFLACMFDSVLYLLTHIHNCRKCMNRPASRVQLLRHFAIISSQTNTHVLDVKTSAWCELITHSSVHVWHVLCTNIVQSLMSSMLIETPSQLVAKMLEWFSGVRRSYIVHICYCTGIHISSVLCMYYNQSGHLGFRYTTFRPQHNTCTRAGIFVVDMDLDCYYSYIGR